MSELSDTIAGFKPVFGNEEHIHIARQISLLDRMKRSAVQTKGTKVKQERLEAHIVWQIQKSQKPQDPNPY